MQDPKNEIKKLSEFLESPLDDDAAAEVANQCDISKMKEKREKFGGITEGHIRKGSQYLLLLMQSYCLKKTTCLNESSIAWSSG